MPTQLSIVTLTPSEKLARALDAIEALHAQRGVRHDAHAQHIIRLGRSALEKMAGGTMKSWMEQHDRTSVDTLQLVLSAPDDNPLAGSWAPLMRTVNAHEYASRVVFLTGEDQREGSARDYRSMRVIRATPDALIVADEWHVILYVAAAGVS